jgi:hypothetical protein
MSYRPRISAVQQPRAGRRQWLGTHRRRYRQPPSRRSRSSQRLAIATSRQ